MGLGHFAVLSDGSSDPYAQRTDTSLNGRQRSAPFAAASVQTFEIDGVVL